MRRFLLTAVGAVGALAISASAWAADPVQVAPVVAEPLAPPAPNVAAAVEVFGWAGMYSVGHVEESNCSDCHGSGVGFGGSGRAAWMMTPTLSMQLDVWAGHWSGYYFEGDEPSDDLSDNRMGVGTHLTYDGGGFQFGGLVSLGASTTDHTAGPPPIPGTFANLAVEAAFNASRFRVYGQAGYVFAVAPADLKDHFADFGVKNFYGRIVGTFYPRPNVALSANVGLEALQAFGGAWGRGILWGARAEFQPDGRPIYFFASYQGAFNAFDNGFTTVEHAVRLGIGINVGSPDLQSRDRAVGLKDFNCVFGVDVAGPCLIDYHGEL